MSPRMTGEQRREIVRQARALIGVPFQHAGRTDRGLDCVGLLVLATQRAGMRVYDNHAYSPVVDSAYMQAELLKAAVPLNDGAKVSPGDVLLFYVGRSPQHLALVVSWPSFQPPTVVHSYQTVGRVVEHELDPTWMRRLAGKYSWRPD